MKKRFLPFSFLLVTMVLAQSLMAAPNGYGTRASNDTVYWHSMGPSNMGGRATSVIFDNQTHKHVYVGSMGGGVFYSWNEGISWHQVGDNLLVSCLAQGEDGTIYVGTGEGFAATDYNGMADLDYEQGFVGSGLYMIKDNILSPVPSTTPTVFNEIGEWSYINEIVISGNNLVVATNAGLRYASIDKLGDAGLVWKYAKSGGEDLTGVAAEVKLASDGTLIASVDGALYMGAITDMKCHSASANVVNENNTIDSIAVAPGILDIAVAPSDPKIIYASAIGTSGNAAGQHVNVYLTEDGGQSWRIILPTCTLDWGHQIYEKRGLFNHGLNVDPMDPYKVYVTGYNLWRLTKPVTDPNGYFMAVQLSDGDNGCIFYADYLHSGVNAMTFTTDEGDQAYMATDGGIFKIKIDNTTIYPTFENCNRGFKTVRSFAVAPSGNLTRVVAGAMDHGPVLIDGDGVTNQVGYSVPLYPTNSPASYGNFDPTYHGGPCAVSTIDGNSIFFVTVDGTLKRTQSAGADYDASNFTGASGQPSFSFTGYRMPIALWETYENEASVDSVQFKCKKDQKAGDVVQCFSSNGNYPFDYVLPCDMHYDTVSPLHSDSIMVKDPITTRFYVADKSAIYFTLDAMRFGKVTDWYKVTTTGGVSSCITVSPDGDMVLVGTRNGRLIRITNMNAAVDSATCTPSSSQFAPVVTVLDPGAGSRPIMSVAVSKDNKKMVVTLGGYGYDNYVIYSNNIDADDPEFASAQGNLDLMPVYSCLIENVKGTGHVLLGTEHGVYRATALGSNPVWTLVDDNMGDVPVMDLKQQTIYHPTQWVPVMDDLGATVLIPYEGVHNQGVIYGATYGKGVFRCETYRNWHTGDNVPEISTTTATAELYPNPVSNAAKVRFDLNQATSVSYQVYDMMGRMVKVENFGQLSEGRHEVEVNVEGLASGAYLLRLNAGQNSTSVKFMVK